MKKLFIILTFAALPFLLIWSAFLLTAFSFNPIEVFQGGTFWGMSVIYWFVYICLIGLIVDGINESKPVKQNYDPHQYSDNMK